MDQTNRSKQNCSKKGNISKNFLITCLLLILSTKKKFSVVNSGHKFACCKHYKHVPSMSLSNNSSNIKITRSKISPITVMHYVIRTSL